MKIYREYAEHIENLLPSDVKKLLNLINSNGRARNIECRLVGGCVRDMILSIKPKDFDFAVNVEPSIFLEFAGFLGLKCVPTGIKHGTITIVYQKNSFEFTSLRNDVITDGRHAVVAFGKDWKDDAERRDFTFNALYIDEKFAIYDYFNGLKDLFDGNLAFIGNAENRIKEDYLRILRAFRFFCRFSKSKSISPNIERSIVKNIDGIDFLSRERIRQEIFFILESDKSYAAIFNMFRIGIFLKIWPSLTCIDYTHVSNQLKKFCNYEKSSIARMAFLARSIKISASEMNLKFSKADYNLINLVFNFDSCSSLKYLYLKNLYHYGKSYLLIILHACLTDGAISNSDYLFVSQKIAELDNDYKPKFPVISKDIANKRGKELGDCITMLKRYWLNSNCKLTKSELLSFIK